MVRAVLVGAGEKGITRMRFFGERVGALVGSSVPTIGARMGSGPAAWVGSGSGDQANPQANRGVR